MPRMPRPKAPRRILETISKSERGAVGRTVNPRSGVKGRTYTSQEAQTHQGLGRIERLNKRTGQWQKTGARRRST